nr:transcriptional activator DEMETER-like [Tanacetum cinerariifolium]
MLDKRDPDDKHQYLLATWPAGETQDRSLRLEEQCSSSEPCNDDPRDKDTILGTILVPCRTATRGSFPLDGTYFQINEVFADDDTSEKPLVVPRKLLLDLTVKTLYCGTSISTIFQAFSTQEVGDCFWEEVLESEEILQDDQSFESFSLDQTTWICLSKEPMEGLRIATVAMGFCGVRANGLKECEFLWLQGVGIGFWREGETHTIDVLRSSYSGLSTTLNVPSIEQLENQKNVLNPFMIEKCKSVKPWTETKREAKGKSPVDLSIGVRNLSNEFEDFSSNCTNKEVNVAEPTVFDEKMAKRLQDEEIEQAAAKER